MDEKMKQMKDFVMNNCICESCPSYKDCGEDYGFCYFSIGKSKCITEEKGCICPSCPVTKEMNLQKDYFCTRGSENDQKS